MAEVGATAEDVAAAEIEVAAAVAPTKTSSPEPNLAGIEIITLRLQIQTQTILTILNLIKGDQEPHLMSQTMRAPGTGKKAVLRLIVVTPSSAPGSTSLPLVRRPEKLASLVLEIQIST